MFPRGFDMTNMDECRKLPGVYEIPVTSAITFPEGEVVYDINEEEVELKGYAYSGAGNRIVRVELTLDDGETWE